VRLRRLRGFPKTTAEQPQKDVRHIEGIALGYYVVGLRAVVIRAINDRWATRRAQGIITLSGGVIPVRFATLPSRHHPFAEMAARGRWSFDLSETIV